jgi:hypothetical protein
MPMANTTGLAITPTIIIQTPNAAITHATSVNVRTFPGLEVHSVRNSRLLMGFPIGVLTTVSPRTPEMAIPSFYGEYSIL